MLRKIEAKSMGGSDRGWLKSIFHFSFAEYYNPENLHFGPLRVINDDLVNPGTGFGMHPHDNMEIISYIVDGKITHNDSMGNSKKVGRGDIQYMSAGRGVEHSEYNLEDEVLRLLQIWIFPDKLGYEPKYGDLQIDWNERVNKFLQLVSPIGGQGLVEINQDANIYVTELDEGKELDFEVGSGRIAYVVQIEGSTSYNDVVLNDSDGMEVIEESMQLKAMTKSHLMIIEMSKEDM